MKFIRNMYDWAIREAATKRAERTLATVSFAESSFFPLPPDIMLVPMVLARPERAWYLAGLTTAASVAGGLLGYAIGHFFITSVGQWIIDLYNLQEGFDKFHDDFAEYGSWIIILKGLTPIPYKLVTIASGMAHFPLAQFIAASVVCRGIRFYLVAGLLRYYGDRARVFIEKYLSWIMLAVLVLLVGGFLLATGMI